MAWMSTALNSLHPSESCYAGKRSYDGVKNFVVGAGRRARTRGSVPECWLRVSGRQCVRACEMEQLRQACLLAFQEAAEE